MTALDPPADRVASPASQFRQPHHPGAHHSGAEAASVPPRSWLGYTAAAVTFTSATVSCYWSLGGRVGLSTLGGAIEQMVLAHDPLIVTTVWVTGALMAVGGLLALALVQAWGRRLARRPLLLTAWAAAGLLTACGVLQIRSVGLVLLGVVDPSQPVDTSVLWWRLPLWELWVVLLGLTTHRARHRTRLGPDRPTHHPRATLPK